MKKVFLILVLFIPTVWADKNFTVCYYNQSTTTILYNNDGVSHTWKNRGDLVGQGSIAPKQSKCFNSINDETIFNKDYITFSINHTWAGIVNSGLSNPYIIAQNAQGFKGGTLYDDKSTGRDKFVLNIFVMANSAIIYTNSKDVNDTKHWIKPVNLK